MDECLASAQRVLGPCLAFVRPLLGIQQDPAQQRLEFERTVAFLESVPLFRQQLPRSELPKVAQHLARKTWAVGQRIVKQGETGRAFFLIHEGEAFVETEEDGVVSVRATLTAGDYFGGHTLTTERPNVATIEAGEGLVTLSMSRKEFEALGLLRWLSFPKRPALYGDMQAKKTLARGMTCATLVHQDQPHLPQDDLDFIQKAFQSNLNFRALKTLSEEKLQELAQYAQKEEVKAGEVLMTAGELSPEFRIVREGKVEALVDRCVRKTSGGLGLSAENAVAHSTMANRLLRKQAFLEELSQSVKRPTGTGQRATASVFAAGGNLQGLSSADARKHRVYSSGMGLEGKKGGASNFSRQISPLDAPMNKLANKAKILDVFRSRSNNERSDGTLPEEDEEKVCPGPETSLLAPGESFGELSMLYNMPLHATYTAKTDCVLYVIKRRHFAQAFNRKGRRFNDICSLLEEVALLTPLLGTERWEMACNSSGFVDFQPGERVLHQGKNREAKRWYIISKGSAVVTYDKTGEDGSVTNMQLAILTRGGHFGERSLIRGDAAAPVSVNAGAEGMTCLTFHGAETILLLKKVMDQEEVPSVHCDLQEWWSRKARGFATHRASLADQLFQQCTIQFEDLERVCVLGKGGYGQVILVREKEKKEKRYALKVCSKGHVQEQAAQRLVTWERELLSMCDSAFVIKLHRTFKDSQFVYFLVEACLGGSLVTVMHEYPEVLQEDSPRGAALAFYIGCVTLALEHLHERRIVHRDLKPENVLLDERGYAKVCDLGFARFCISRTNTLAGTPEYMAPEMIDFPHTHGFPVDWWALGVISFELLAGQTPFQDEGISDPAGRLLAIRRSQEMGILTFPFNFPYMVKPFISGLLVNRPDDRLGVNGAQDVMDHAFFKAIRMDMAALRERSLPSPCQREWTDPALDRQESGLGCSGHNFGLKANDSIFMQYTCVDADWDAKF